MLAPASIASAHGVGIERIALLGDANTALDAVVFFPAPVPPVTTRLGPYDVLALPDAPPAPGRFPLILISHGSRGSMLSHHALASHLALNGVVVAALSHEGDNFRDASGLGKTSSAYSRARHVSRLLTATLNGSHGQRIDQQRIGIIGYSAGSITAMMLAGASPDFGRLEAYCKIRPRRSGICEAHGVIEGDVPRAVAMLDVRIKAALLLAPIGVVLQESLAAVRVPVGIVAAQADEQLSLQLNLRPFLTHLRELALVEMVPGAGHFIFLAPCTDRQSATSPELCKDRPFIDRSRVQSMINELAISFFSYAFELDANQPQGNAEPLAP